MADDLFCDVCGPLLPDQVEYDDGRPVCIACNEFATVGDTNTVFPIKWELKLKLIKELLANGKKAEAKKRYKELVSSYNQFQAEVQTYADVLTSFEPELE